MFNRETTLNELFKRLTYYPGVVLLGARQVGKSTLAQFVTQTRSNAVYLDLELPADRAKLDNPSAFFAAHRDALVVLDEVQTVPGIFTVLRPEIDADRRPGRFLLLGSASGALLRQSAESLAGRVSYLELPPLLAHEVLGGQGTNSADTPAGNLPLATPSPSPKSSLKSSPSNSFYTDLLRYWQRGGFPLSYTARSDAQSLRWRNDYLQAVLQRDLPALGITIPSQTLGRFLRMLAHQHGQLFNASALAVAMGGISHTTVSRYLDILCDALLVRRVAPYFVNVGKRLVKAPKVYLRDTGLLHALLGVPNADALQSHPIVGHSWEGLVMQHLAAQVPLLAEGGATLHFYRTAAGAELDAVVDTGSERIGFEIKFSEAPRVTKGFWHAITDLNLHRAYVVAPIAISATAAGVASPSKWPLGELTSQAGAGQQAEVISLFDLPRVLGVKRTTDS